MLDPSDPAASHDPARRSAIRLLCAIHELHRAGYQRVRFSSGLAPSGMYWRCSVTHAGNISDDGLRIADHTLDGEVAAYSTGSGDRYFGWPDAPGRSAQELAAMFAERFPRIMRKGEGRDWAYAGWLTETIGRAERGGTSGLPVFFADYPLDIDPGIRPPPPQRPTGWQRVWNAVRRARNR